jgi:hypothetical protein
LPLAPELFTLPWTFFMLKKLSTALLCGLAVAKAAAQTRPFLNTQH